MMGPEVFCQLNKIPAEVGALFLAKMTRDTRKCYCFVHPGMCNPAALSQLAGAYTDTAVRKVPASGVLLSLMSSSIRCTWLDSCPSLAPCKHHLIRLHVWHLCIAACGSLSTWSLLPYLPVTLVAAEELVQVLHLTPLVLRLAHILMEYATGPHVASAPAPERHNSLSPSALRDMILTGGADCREPAMWAEVRAAASISGCDVSAISSNGSTESSARGRALLLQHVHLQLAAA
jgi:hypothetical protein